MSENPMVKCRHDVLTDCPACMQGTIDVLAKALQQIKVVCEDNRRAKDIGPGEEMTLYFIQQISEQALRASVFVSKVGE